MKTAFDLSQMGWDNGKFWLLSYVPTHTGKRAPATDLILRFKQNEPIAFTHVRRLAIEAFIQCENDLLDDVEEYMLMALPRSQANAPNEPCEALCAVLAEQFSWLMYQPQAFRRVESVPKAAKARKEGRDRPDYERHIQTISYEGPSIDCLRQGIITVDDVLTTGDTFAACYGILKDETQCEQIVGMFVGRTVNT
jgi:hypothetical protein